MLRLPPTPLSVPVQQQLDQYQRDINEISEYAARVAAAKDRFTAYNKGQNPTFRAVKGTLTKMCSGARRCMYCEDSSADEVEHIKPKDLYPEFVFVWENYLYTCGPCNGPKSNRYAVFSKTTGQRTEVSRQRGQPIVPPEEGDPLLLDPRREDPLEYMELDLIDTFFFLPIEHLSPVDQLRAEYTIEILRLNDRDLLPAAREEAYRNYRARLIEYIRWRDKNTPAAELRNLVKAIKKMHHPTVWHEMKRQHQLIPELRNLFEEAPESLDW